MKYIGWFLLAIIVVGGLSLFTGMCSDTINTVQKEYAPSALLRKYEWFKDASAQLDSKIATMETYKSRFTGIKEQYGQDSSHRAKWSREDREQYNLWESEFLGIKASYNDLASEYNSQMAKFNWRFCNKGSLPEGADIPLPREYKPYIYN